MEPSGPVVQVPRSSSFGARITSTSSVVTIIDRRRDRDMLFDLLCRRLCQRRRGVVA
jgi:hypothetical protein